RLEELREDIELTIQPEIVQSVKQADRAFQNHKLTTLETIPAPSVARRVPTGTVLVRTDQSLGRLATFLLEPSSEDGLAVWNFFDTVLKKGVPYPVTRLVKDTPILTGPVRPLAEERAPIKTVTPDHATGKLPPPNFFGDPVRGLRWLPDGEHFLQAKNGKLWKVHAASGRAEPSFDPQKLAATLAKMPAVDAKTADAIARGTRFDMNPQVTGFVFNHGNDLYYAAFDGSKAVRLTKTPAHEELATFSPDGQWVA